MFTLFDRKVGEYASLVLATTDEAVVRALKEGIPGGSTQAKYPEDFELVCVGTFDPVSGRLNGLNMPIVVASLSAILEREKSDA